MCWFHAQASATAASPGASLSNAAAHHLVDSWVTIKARALGPQHAVVELKSILAGPALEQWTLRAQGLANMQRSVGLTGGVLGFEIRIVYDFWVFI